MDAEKLSSINKLRARFPALSVSDARSLLERHGWNGTIAAAEADRSARQSAKSGSNSYFVGGGDKGSGQAVMAPPGEDSRRSDGVRSLIDGIFRKAQEEGAKEGQASDSSDGEQRAFYGRGQRLGYTTNPSPYIASTLRAERTVRVTVYRNGFEIEDGSFVPLDSDEGRQFLTAMDRGFVPAPLAAKYPSTDLTVNLRDCMQVDYLPPAYTAFQGHGQRLAAPHRTSAPEVTPTATANPSAGATSYDPVRKVEVHDDEEKSFVVLLNTRGERRQVLVNPTRHTVEDLYSLAHAYQPEVDHFFLVERGMPPRRMKDAMRSQTVAEAKLTRAVLAIQQV